jgi:hypothetical protein
MKSPIAITLIICGTLLVIAPYVNNAIVMGQLTGAVAAIGKPVNLTGDIPKYTSTICTLLGIAMIIGGARKASQKLDEGDK